MNVLSSYAQTHYRLPCPADPKASAAQAGHEEDKCTAAGTTEGILPWKELAMGVALLDLRLPGYEGSFAGARTPMTFLPS
jgi:hypothetical protein